jgi:hypothetical protein
VTPPGRSASPHATAVTLVSNRRPVIASRVNPSDVFGDAVVLGPNRIPIRSEFRDVSSMAVGKMPGLVTLPKVIPVGAVHLLALFAAKEME